MEKNYLAKTPMLNYDAAPLQELILTRRWKELDVYSRIGAIYDYVRNEILFGYNRSDTLSATEVLADGYGQCNTKATLLMALLRACGIPCRLHGSEVSKGFQRGATSGIISVLAPEVITHTWAEVYYEGHWIALEGVITDETYVQGVKRVANIGADIALTPCGVGGACAGASAVDFRHYAISVPDLAALDLTWRGEDLFVQNTSVVTDFGVFDDPDSFFEQHKQTWSKAKDFAYVHYGRKIMNRNVARIRGSL